MYSPLDSIAISPKASLPNSLLPLTIDLRFAYGTQSFSLSCVEALAIQKCQPTGGGDRTQYSYNGDNYEHLKQRESATESGRGILHFLNKVDAPKFSFFLRSARSPALGLIHIWLEPDFEYWSDILL